MYLNIFIVINCLILDFPARDELYEEEKCLLKIEHEYQIKKLWSYQLNIHIVQKDSLKNKIPMFTLKFII